MKIEKRKSDTNKADYGRICLVGGSLGMAGSIYLASISALRAGAGLVYSVVPETIASIMQIKSLENIIKILPCEKGKLKEDAYKILDSYIEKMNVIAIGCGMGKDPRNIKLIETVLKTDKALVIDADGLNSIKDLKVLARTRDYMTVLTPHPLEFSRLTGYSVAEIKKNPRDIACKFSKENKVILVLKTNKTLVVRGNEVYVNTSGNPGMATAGSGDCLTGIIASLLHRKNPFEAAKLGVYVHGLAGDLAAKELGEEGMIAGDIIKYLPYALEMCKEK